MPAVALFAIALVVSQLGFARGSAASRVLLVAPTFPWNFGAYQNQQALLGDELFKMGYDVYWNAAFRDLGSSASTFTAEEAARVMKYQIPVGYQLTRAKQFTYIHIPVPESYHKNVKMGRAIVVSAINKQATKHNIDAVIFLMDGNNIFVDDPFDIYSIMWYPLHFSSIVPWTRDILRSFDTVVALAPSAAAILGQPKYALRQVATIPHIVELPDGWNPASRMELRAKYNVPLDAFVVLVNCGNYEPSNRKGLDVALLSFKKFLADVPNAFLYLKVISIRSILQAEGDPAESNSMPAIDMPALLRLVELPTGSYLLQQDMMESTAPWDLMLLADVLLMPSKAEGFGMPMLEAQLLGTPVVTTAFGAMKDYTRFGVSVEPLQPTLMEIAFAAMPSVDGCATALVKVYMSRLSPNNLTQTSTMAWVHEEFSAEAVGRKFDSLIVSGAANKTESVSVTEVPANYRIADLNWFFSLPIEKPELLLDLVELGVQDAPQWALLWSESARLRVDVLESLQEKYETGLGPDGGDVTFFLTKRADGTTFPDPDDLQKGILVPNLIILMRTDRLLYVAKHLGFTSLDQLMRLVLANHVPFKRPMQIRVDHVIVADEKVLARDEIYIS